MAALGEHTHHIKIRSTQLEIPSNSSNMRDDDFDRKLRDAQEDLDRIQLQREELERKKRELEEFTERKHTFLSQQIEFSEKLTSSLTLIDRELFEIRQEANDLEECRVGFANHLDKIQKINPESWTREAQADKLEKAFMTLDMGSDDYDQAAAHFEGTRSGAIFGRASKRSRGANRSFGSSEFMANLRNGFAFNLPIVVLGGLALVVYLSK